MIKFIYLTTVFQLFLSSFGLGVVYAKDPVQAHDDDDARSERELLFDARLDSDGGDLSPCASNLSIAPVDSIIYFRSRLPDSSRRKFTKKELELLFGFRSRALRDREKLAMIETGEEKMIVGAILRRPVNVTQKFSLKEINEKILLGAFQRLAYRFARIKYANHPKRSLDDLVQASMIGLYNAIESYNETTPWMFSSVAFRRMAKEIAPQMALDESVWDLKISNGSSYWIVLAIEQKLFSRFGRRPTSIEIANDFNSRYTQQITPEGVSQILSKKQQAGLTFSESEQLRSEEVSDSDEMFFSALTAIDYVVDDRDQSLEAILRDQERSRKFGDAISTLPFRIQMVLKLRYGFDIITEDTGPLKIVPASHDGMTFDEVGKILGITRSRVSQLEAKAFRLLKHPSRPVLPRD